MLRWIESIFTQIQAPNLSDVWQVGVIVSLWLLVSLPIGATRRFRKEIADSEEEKTSPRIWLSRNATLPILSLLILAVAASLLAFSDITAAFLWAIGFLFIVWTVIGILTSLLRDRFWADSTSLVLYLITAFFLLTVDDSLVDILDRMHLPISAGETPLSIWNLFTVGFSLAIAIWIGLGISQFVEKWIESIDRVNPSTRALFQKVIRVLFIVFALVIGLTSVGINLSALAIFGGAFALGLGFGLQKIVSNLISGFILLSDRSIKPGDVIELEGSYGWINTLRARYVSVITRDGTEHLIPNEDLITQRVVNWSYSHDQVRVKCAIGVSYGEDPHRVIEICKEAALSQPRVLRDPAPACLLTEFGDSSVNLELRFWITDPNQGVANLRSGVLLEIWDRFKEEGIEIPFPQRDLHLKSWMGNPPPPPPDSP